MPPAATTEREFEIETPTQMFCEAVGCVIIVGNATTLTNTTAEVKLEQPPGGKEIMQ